MAKTCVICREDCSGLPRTKDAKGRYFCQSCYDDALERKRSREVAAVAASIMEIPDEPAHVNTAAGCPGCHHPISPGAALCVNCGYNLQTGGAMQTAVAKAPKKTRDLSFAWTAGTVCMAITTVLIFGLLGVAAITSSVMAWFTAILVLSFFGMWVTLRTVYEAYHASGLIMALLCFFIPLVWPVWLLIGGSKLLKVAFLIYVLSAIAGLGMLAVHDGLINAMQELSDPDLHQFP